MHEAAPKCSTIEQRDELAVAQGSVAPHLRPVDDDMTAPVILCKIAHPGQKSGTWARPSQVDPAYR
jgi:hypothetical protein